LEVGVKLQNKQPVQIQFAHQKPGIPTEHWENVK